MEITKDLYEILEIDRDASKTEIKKAYRTLSKQYHPDMKTGDEDKFKEVSYAYEILSNDEKRTKYDSFGHEGLKRGFAPNSGPSMHDMSDMFRQMFRNAPHTTYQQKRNYGIRLRLGITVEQVFNGVDKTFEYDRIINCTTCNSKGGKNPKRCHECDGLGQISRVMNTQHGQIQQISTCHVCGGSGESFEDLCLDCQGQGLKKTKEKLTLKLDHGYLTGDVVLKRGMGHMTPEGTYGNLEIHIEVQPHQKFNIEANLDLLSIIHISYETLILGGKAKFTTIEGTTVKVTVPKFTKIGDKLRLKSKGLKLKDSKTRTNQILMVDVELPTSISVEEKELLEKIKKLKE